MPLPRRRFLAGAAALAGGGLAGCALPPALRLQEPPWPEASHPAWRALSRLTYGPRPEELARAAEIGVAGWIEEQLAPGQLPDWRAELAVQPLEALFLDAATVLELPEEHARRDLQRAMLLRAVYSRRQLLETMVEFWGDHLHIPLLKEGCGHLKVADDREVIRRHALGSFRDLLWASMCSPAMLVSLDNQENNAGAPNENYARELLELHTLGVAGGYGQRDVQEVARCLTGWSVDTGLFRGRQRFFAERHDDGPKQVLGVTLPAGGGSRDVEQLCELLVSHPATARHLAFKLVRRLVADDPPPALVAAAAATFDRTRGDIRATLRTILLAPEFAAAPGKLRRPLDFAVAALRQLDATTDGGPALLEALARMGQAPFAWPMPDGYPDTAAPWRAGLLLRWQLALRLVQGDIPGTSVDLVGLAARAQVTTLGQAAASFATLLLGASIAARGQLPRGDIDITDLRLLVATLLASPEYQWR